MAVSYEEVMAMLQRGILDRKSGVYSGQPGREVFEFVSSAESPKRVRAVAKAVASAIPSSYGGRASNLSTFLRYVYGCGEKNGVLLSFEQCDRWKREGRDWSRIHQFMLQVCSFLERFRNTYGLVICREMMAHRLADEAVILGDPDRMERAIDGYEWVTSAAESISALKNIYSSRYWACRYLCLFRPDDSRCVPLAVRFIDAADKYCHKKLVRKKIVWLFGTISDIGGESGWRTVVSRANVCANPIILFLSNTAISGIEECRKKGVDWRSLFHSEVFYGRLS